MYREASPHVPVVDVFSILTTVRADGALEAHLAPYDWRERPGTRTLCRLPIANRPPAEDYPERGCLRCGIRAVAVGIDAVRRHDGAVASLSGYVTSRLEAN